MPVSAYQSGARSDGCINRLRGQAGWYRGGTLRPWWDGGFFYLAIATRNSAIGGKNGKRLVIILMSAGLQATGLGLLISILE